MFGVAIEILERLNRRNAWIPLFARSLCALWLFGLALGGAALADPAASQRAVLDPALPYSIDLSPFYVQTLQPDGTSSAWYQGFGGLKTIDGLPFHIDGKIMLYGKEYADRGDVYSYALTGIKIGHKFDELHLIHAGEWRDYFGCPVATLRLNYADGTMHDFTIRFDFQVNDRSRLLTEDEEIIADPETKVVWRGPAGPMGTSRLFKSVLHNPFPEKMVDTMDLLSARSGVAYVLFAATVAQANPKRKVTPPLPLIPSRNFAGSLNVHVVDAATGAPIAGAKVYPAMVVGNFGLVADNALTGADGIALINYPKGDTKDLRIKIAAAGYAPNQDKWQTGWDGASIPPDFTCQLARGEDSALYTRAVVGHWKTASGSLGDVDLKQVQVYLQPQSGPPPFPIDADTEEKKRDWLQSWKTSEAGRKFEKYRNQTTPLEIKADGTFSGAGVELGDYTLTVADYLNGKLVGKSESQVTVAPYEGTDPAPPVDVGLTTVDVSPGAANQGP